MDDDTMRDYSGALREDFTWQHLEKTTMARFAREVMLCNQIHDRAMMPLVAGRWGADAMTAQAIDEWMGCSPVYNARIRALHNIQGDGVDVIMKGFQLDIGAPHMWLKFHFDVRSHDQGFFWLTSCGAYDGVRGMTGGDKTAETQICVHMEDPTFDATVMAVNRGARCVPIYRPPHGGDIPAAGPCRWEVSINDHIGLVEENPQTEIIERSRAGCFQFTRPAATDDGLPDYSGAFNRDFRLEDLCSSMLSVQLKEFALDVHLLQRSSYLSMQRNYGKDAALELISEHCSAMAPVYQARLRRLFGIEGNNLSAILKLLQLDHHFVPEYVKTGVKLFNESSGQFWIEDCEAIDDGTTSGVLTDLWQGGVRGLEQIVQAVNPQAVVTTTASEPGRRFVYDIRIDPQRQPAAASRMSELVGSFGLLDADLTEHLYTYEDAESYQQE